MFDDDVIDDVDDDAGDVLGDADVDDDDDDVGDDVVDDDGNDVSDADVDDDHPSINRSINQAPSGPIKRHLPGSSLLMTCCPPSSLAQASIIHRHHHHHRHHHRHHGQAKSIPTFLHEHIYSFLAETEKREWATRFVDPRVWKEFLIVAKHPYKGPVYLLQHDGGAVLYERPLIGDPYSCALCGVRDDDIEFASVSCRGNFIICFLMMQMLTNNCHEIIRLFEYTFVIVG